jgi:predicted nucleic acid-binding protein
MKASLIDTDILSEFLKGNINVINKVDEHVTKHGSINISVITYYEIVNGLLYKDAKKQLSKFEDFIELCNVIPLTQIAAKQAAIIQSELRKKGNEIGHTDTLIAGTALANNFLLVTNNTEHFKRVKNLSIANWKK